MRSISCVMSAGLRARLMSRAQPVPHQDVFIVDIIVVFLGRHPTRPIYGKRSMYPEQNGLAFVQIPSRDALIMALISGSGSMGIADDISQR